MVEGSLDTTHLLLGILAAVSVVEVVLLVGIGVMVWRLYAHARRTIHEVEQRQIAPLAARANALMTSVDDVLTDVKGITSRVAQQAERLDSAIRTTVDHADETAGRVRRAVAARANRVIGVMRGVRVACDTFFTRRTDNGRASGPSTIRGAGSPKEE
jgi:sensor histidine kinase regulating citrate/malate metabolism